MALPSADIEAAGESGPALFARYAYPPNELGHCGPPGADVLLERAASGSDELELRRRATQFDGAWPYLEVISAAAGLADPLDRRVVRAYWLGSPPLGAVDAATFAATAQHSFGHQPGVPERVSWLARDAGPAAVRAHHGFHVFVVYPWVGLLGSDSDVPRSVLDTCRVRWGTVLQVGREDASVLSQPLVWDGGRLSLGTERVETVRWASHGHAFVRGLHKGDTVSLHWDWICDRLSADEVETLRAGTLCQLDATNRWLAARAEA